MIEITGVTKRYGERVVVDQVSFTAPSGSVTGFLGPNGAGKTTTLRMLLGLARPDAGEALVDSLRYTDLSAPRRVVGAVIDAMGFHPARTGRNHLRVVLKRFPKMAIEVESHLNAAMAHDRHHFLWRPTLFNEQTGGRVSEAMKGVARSLNLVAPVALAVIHKAGCPQQGKPN